MQRQDWNRDRGGARRYVRDHGHERGHTHGHGHAHAHHERVTRSYQANMIITQISVDAGDVNITAAASAPARAKAAVIAPYTIEFEPDEETLNAAKDALGDVGAGEGATGQAAPTAGKTRAYLHFRGTIDVYADLRREILRIGGEKNASNAFLKYYEIAYSFLQPMRDLPPRVVAFFNAELPGSSMVSFNHYFRTIRPDIDYSWYASSLWSSELVEGSYGLGDSYGYVANNRDRWLMNDTNNGDMTSVDNILDIASRIGPRGVAGVAGVDIYSHDAGIDVSGGESGDVRYDVQEESNMWLHLGCALAGFLTLRTGPATLFIAKQYTFYRTFTWQLILLYASLFDRFYLTKPLTSRPTNSEIYLIGIGFRGCPAHISEFMRRRLQTRDSSPFIPEATARLMPAIGALRTFARNVYGQQRDMLLEIVRLHHTYTAEQITAGTRELKRQLIARWLMKHPVKRIDPAARVPSN